MRGTPATSRSPGARQKPPSRWRARAARKPRASRSSARGPSERGSTVSRAARKPQTEPGTPAELRGQARPATGPDGGAYMTETTASGAAQDGTGARKGLTIRRIHSREGDHPYDEITWERRDVVMTNWRDGSVHFAPERASVPH